MGKNKVLATTEERLRQIYEGKMLKAERQYNYEGLYSRPLTSSDFSAKPMVLLLGQYSTGKSSFVEYLLRQKYPGSHIGPEPTTDRFVAVMHGPDARVTPGNALAVQADRPFKGLEAFGNGFLTKFQSAELPSPILENVTFIDTPGVLSGEKQRLNRGYDFSKVCGWFAERADLIFVIFDAHKLDISDEMKTVIASLKGHHDKIRIVLNKADAVSSQELMRVYGALMWSLGKILNTPEAFRVYLGSFWDKPYKNQEFRDLFESEKEDLLSDLSKLPQTGAVRKVNELLKRARMVRVHAAIMGSLRDKMPTLFGKESKQKKLLQNLEEHFNKIQIKYRIPMGDMPDVLKYQAYLANIDFSKLPHYNPKLLEQMDEILGHDLTSLLNDIQQGEKKAPIDLNAGSTKAEGPWAMSEQSRRSYAQFFVQANPIEGKLSGDKAKDILTSSGLSNEVLRHIWRLSDVDQDGMLDQDEFSIAMHLIQRAREGSALPPALPASLLPAKYLGSSPF